MDAKNILIVDDETELVEVLKDLLTELGFKVTTACDGAEGLLKLKEAKPNLIVLDMNMPRMGGISFYKKLCDSGNGKPGYPILVITGRSNLEEFFKDMAIDGFLAKPFPLDTFLERVDAIFKKWYGRGIQLPKASGSKKVLVVDHDHIHRGVLQKLYEADGHQILEAKDTAEGSKLASQENLDLILIRLDLPETQGDVLALKLKMIPKTMEVPIILYSTKQTSSTDYSAAGRIYEKLDIRVLAGVADFSILLQESNLLWNKKAAA